MKIKFIFKLIPRETILVINCNFHVEKYLINMISFSENADIFRKVVNLRNPKIVMESIESTTPVYTLSIASTLSGIPVHSIRQYIDKGLIIPFRKDSNRHLFSQVDILRLNYIEKLLTEDGLNIAGIRSILALIPCWSIRECSAEERETCQAFQSNTFPCWEASEKVTLCKNTNCKECEVYRIVENYPDLKTYFKTRLP